MHAEGFDSWAILELMGHVRMAGRVTEEERFGSKVGRIDVPYPETPCKTCGETGSVLPFGTCTSPTCPDCGGAGHFPGGFTTVYFTAASIYRMTPTTEAIARGVAKGTQPKPVHRWELPSPDRATAVLNGEWDDDHENNDDD